MRLFCCSLPLLMIVPSIHGGGNSLELLKRLYEISGVAEPQIIADLRYGKISLFEKLLRPFCLCAGDEGGKTLAELFSK